MSSSTMRHNAEAQPLETSHGKHLGFWDAVSIIIGIVVGTAIFKAPTMVFQNVTGPWPAYGVWMLGGALSICGAFCYAELATAYPRNGGDYEYLGRAYGRWLGFLFGWAQLTVVLSGSIASMAYAFGDYAIRIWSLPPDSVAWLATGAVGLLSALNLLGVLVGKTAQNILSFAKVLGLAGVATAGLWAADSAATHVAQPDRALMGPGFGLAMVFVLYAFGGWNDAAYVAAEVRNPNRSLPLALFAGIGGITAIYLVINYAYVSVLGFDAARQTQTPAADALEQTVGPWGARAVSALVMVSALGAINGMVLTGSRIYAAMGTDHPIFARLGRWNRTASAPVAALVAQGAIALLLILAVGTDWGQQTLDRGLMTVGLKGLPWEAYFGGFETLVAGTAPVFWAFFLLTGVSLILLRLHDPHRPRPFRVPWFPLPVIVFCLMASYMLYSSMAYAKWLSLLGFIPLAVGVPIYLLSQRSAAT